MRAIGIREFGGREKLELLDVPEPKVPPDAVKIRIHAAGVNPVDWKLREGRLEPRFLHFFPVVIGWDAAGVVEEVGPGVVEVAPGDEVFAYCRKHFIGEGTYGEFVSVPVTFVAKKPRTLSFEEAGAFPLTALAAYQALFFGAGLTAGETALVYGAAGGVGSFAVGRSSPLLDALVDREQEERHAPVDGGQRGAGPERAREHGGVPPAGKRGGLRSVRDRGVASGVRGAAALSRRNRRGIWAGVLLGIVNAVSAHYIGQYITSIILLGAAALTLLIRPRGLLGR